MALDKKCDHCGIGKRQANSLLCVACERDLKAAVRYHKPCELLAADPEAEAAGRAAAAAGEPEEACPHADGVSRYWWFHGYYDAKVRKVYG